MSAAKEAIQSVWTAADCRPIRSAAALHDLVEAAKQDDHVVIAPTHIGTKHDQVVGYMSLGGAPMLHVWLASDRVHAGEAVRLLETAEAMLADKHTGLVVVPCAAESPFTPYMERLGYHKLGTTVLWAKQI